MQVNIHTKRILIPLFSSVIFYFAFLKFNDVVLGVNNHYFGDPLNLWGLYIPSLNFNASLLPDIILHILLGYLIYFFSKKISLFLVVQFILFGIIDIGNAIHISYFGEPISAYDLFSISALYDVLPLSTKIFILFPVLAYFLLFFYNLKVPSHASALVPLVAIVVLVVMWNASEVKSSIGEIYPYKPWNKKFNYDSRGPLVYWVDEMARFVTDREDVPSKEDVFRIAGHLSAAAKSKSKGENTYASDKRNIHLLIVESLWDVSLLSEAKFSSDPFYREFRVLWDSSGNSTVMSPVFGGGTANAEFEVLCGQPVSTNGVTFQVGLTNEYMPCLPNILRENGYYTVASHPNKPAFWNRVNAYRRLGFEAYNTKRQFDLDDLNGPNYLSNRSLFSQNREYIGLLGSEKPIFNYVLTISEHWPYHLSKDRSSFIQSSSREELVAKYANSIYYSTSELMEHLDILRENEPNALIVILGDHLPMLGKAFSGYRESNLFMAEKSKFSAESAEIFTSTPLIVIDGQKGVQKLGAISMYELAGMILDYVRLPRPSALQVFSRPDDTHVRPISGLGILLKNENGSTLCNVASYNDDYCNQYIEWVRSVTILSRDLRIGKQYLLEDSVNSDEGKSGSVRNEQ